MIFTGINDAHVLSGRPVLAAYHSWISSRDSDAPAGATRWADWRQYLADYFGAVPRTESEIIFESEELRTLFILSH